jgi:hypothetical protein
MFSDTALAKCPLGNDSNGLHAIAHSSFIMKQMSSIYRLKGGYRRYLGPILWRADFDG